MSGILAGIRVLDFGRYIAGPYCACLLGDLGAEVIRIEKRTGSEDRYIAPIAAGGEGALFLQVNRNKKSLTLNPTTPAGRDVVQRLVATADVVVANLPPETLKQMGLDYESLVASKPDIILTTVNTFGSGGPYSNRVGFDGIAQVMSGSVYLSGLEGAPTKAWAPWVDFGTASLSAFATLAALLARTQTGKGQQVEGALLKTALTFMNPTLIEQAVTQINRKPSGNRGQTAAPSDVFQTKDGWIISQVLGQPLYERWAKLMGEDHWLHDPRFADDNSRGIHGHLISARMAVWCAERTSAEVLQIMEDARIPAGPVYAPQQALDDPHINALGFLEPVDYPGLPKPAPLAGIPVSLSDTPGHIRCRAPLLGEHTDEIMTSLGYSQAEIAALRDKRVI
jgi:crotonobetainyl-CoA:carnitine CoA-transferase CaiB-like acyl-CoA transferase